MFVDSSDKEFYENPESFTLCDYILEMIWNVLAISCRVITLALFATQYDLFVTLVVVQCFLCFMVCGATTKWEESACGMSFFYGMYCTLMNIIPVSFTQNENLALSYWWYVAYWWMTMAQNTVMIAMWAAAMNDMDVWYTTPVVGYVTLAYTASLLVKTYHVRKRHNNKDKPMRDWFI